MKHARLDGMTKGWFVGAFTPTAHSTDACEVALKEYKAGDYEPRHYHKIATETTLVVRGRVHMCGRDWAEGDIITLDPGEATDFRALTDAITVAVKVPGVLNDKYMSER